MLDYTVIETPTVKRTYTKSDIIVSVVSFILGYLFIKWILFTQLGLSAFVFTILLIAVSICYLNAKKIRITLNSIIFISITVIFSSVFILSANTDIKALVMLYVILSTVYWFYYTCNKHNENIVNEMFVFYFIKSVFVMPFSCFFNIYESFFNMFKKRKPSKKVGYIILGILCAIIPTMIITGLLVNADDAFAKLILNITRIKLFDFGDFSLDIFQFFIGIPVAMYIFGTLYSNSQRMNKQALSREINENIIQKLKFTPELIVYTAVTPICLIYVLFFISQSAYFLSAFSSIIPTGFTYAEYARRGFFELCNVSIINSVIIAVITMVTKQSPSKKINVLKIYIVTIAVLTLMLIATALSKMVMYINAYGLTLLRIYTSWFMILLACIFVVVIIKQFVNPKNMNFFMIVFVIFVILFAALIFCDVDAIIAQYNIENYLNGNLESLDYDMLIYELSDSAVEYIVPVMYESQYESILFVRYKSITDWKNFNFATYNAIEAVKLLK